MTSSGTEFAAWWRAAVTYQVYPRSFADGNGDGIGDIAGIRSRLPYIRELGVDAIWLNPCYPSPMADAGYDVADYRAIDPLFGTLAEARSADRGRAQHWACACCSTSCPNHLRASTRGSGPRSRRDRGRMSAERFLFRPGRGRRLAAAERLGERLRRSAWTRIRESDGTPGSGTCTLRPRAAGPELEGTGRPRRV